MRVTRTISLLVLAMAALLVLPLATRAEVYRSSDQPAGRWGLTPDEIRVTLSPGTGFRFLEVVDRMMGTRIVKALGHSRYIVRKGDLGETDDYAAFFAAAPYVMDVRPRPHRRPEEHVPGGELWVGLDSGAAPGGGGPSGTNYVPGEMLVKFKKGVSAAQIAAFDAEHSTVVKGTLKLGNETIYKLGVPEGVDVRDLVAVYSASDLVEYAEPNYKMGIPERPGTIPNRGQTGASAGFSASVGGIAVNTRELNGDSVLVTYKPGVVDPVPALVAMVYGVRDIEDEDDGSVRYSLPAGVNPLTATRLFKLCPYVLAAEPAP